MKRRSFLRGVASAILLSPVAKVLSTRTRVKWTMLMYATPIIFVPSKKLTFINVHRSSAELGVHKTYKLPLDDS